MSHLENNNLEKNIKICAAVRKHKCLYNRIALRKNPPDECCFAWKAVANECNEPIKYCKNRWTSLYKSFLKGLKRRGSLYYMHEHMKFLLEKEDDKIKNKREREASSSSRSITNDESRSTTSEQNYEQDGSHRKDLTDATNTDDNEFADSDSQTSSAAESNELNNTRELAKENQNLGLGVFIIDEFGEEVNKGGNRRSPSYKRPCKRGPHSLIDDLSDNEEPDGKRTCRNIDESCNSLTESQNMTSNIMFRCNKKLVVRVDKLKINKQTNVSASADNSFVPKSDELCLKKSIDTSKLTNISSNQRPNMIDRYTITNCVTKDSSTQYEPLVNHQDYDEIFIQSVKNQMEEMNARQKLNFKRKVYQSLLDVFDDATEFPNAEEILQCLPKPAPPVLNTTMGEIRLMRELVALVRAAKNTPEIMDCNEKVRTNPPASQSKSQIKIPTTPSLDNCNKAQNSPLSLSPSLEDKDLLLSIDDDDDDSILPNSWDEIRAKPTDIARPIPRPIVKNIGLPNRLLRKVVRVSSSSGSTIVAHDGNKKRIYRIYPKSINAHGNSSVDHKNGSTVGTSYAAPNKNASDVRSKNLSNLENITMGSIRADVNTSNQSSNTANKTLTGQQNSLRNVHPFNQILSPTTGLFKTVPASKPLSAAGSTPPSNPASQGTGAIKKIMLPPNIILPNKNPFTVRSHLTSAHLTTSPVAQRRYSVCGFLPAKTSGINSAEGSVAKNFASPNQNSPKISNPISQIQISKPISLNNQAPNSQNRIINAQTVKSTNSVTSNIKAHTSISNVSTKKGTETAAPSTNVKIPITAMVHTEERNTRISDVTIKLEPVDG